jgi:lipopolysaccharide transport system ATP-binding protein
MKPIIEAQNVGKEYKIGLHRGYLSLREQLVSKTKRIIKQLVRKNDNGGRRIDEFWALRDVSFNVNQGEAVGIIGRNGAGKSTLLKILSKITPPTTGKIWLRGRVASLLEVGTGFHPELTGRENIYLNGTILGMTRPEIKNKFDEIVAFSEIEKFVDTPVKRYSSGMYVRLAFAVAAHLEPEILVVDEVLAVGDREFQKKCLGKMGDVTQEGRTVLFVSHNMDAIAKLCPRTIVIDLGRNIFYGDSKNAIKSYLSLSTKNQTGPVDLTQHAGRSSQMRVIARKIGLRTERSGSKYVNAVFTGDSLVLDVYFDCNDCRLDLIQVGVSSLLGQRVFTVGTHHDEQFNRTIAGRGVVQCHLPSVLLSPGDYTVTVMMGKRTPPHNVDCIENAMTFHVDFGNYFGSGVAPLQEQGYFAQISNWILGEWKSSNDREVDCATNEG